MTLPSPVPAHRAEPWNSLVNFPWASLHDQIPSLCPGPALDRTRLATRAVRWIMSTRLHRTRDGSQQHPQYHPVPVILPPGNDVANGMASKRGGRLIGPGGENAFRPSTRAGASATARSKCARLSFSAANHLSRLFLFACPSLLRSGVTRPTRRLPYIHYSPSTDLYILVPSRVARARCASPRATRNPRGGVRRSLLPLTWQTRSLQRPALAPALPRARSWRSASPLSSARLTSVRLACVGERRR